MSTRKNHLSNRASSLNHNKTHLKEAANLLLHDSKKVANELYEEGRHRVTDVQKNLKGYSNEIVSQVHQRPFLSLLTAAGIGFILASFFRR